MFKIDWTGFATTWEFCYYRQIVEWWGPADAEMIMCDAIRRNGEWPTIIMGGRR